MDEIRFRYGPTPRSQIEALLIAAAGALFMTFQALTNDRGLVINRIIHLGATGATIFYLVVAVLFWIMAVYLFRDWRERRRTGDRYLVIGATALAFTDQAGRVLEVIAYRDIVDIRRPDSGELRLLHIEGIAGAMTILGSQLPRPDDFDDVADLIAARTKAARLAMRLEAARGPV